MIAQGKVQSNDPMGFDFEPGASGADDAGFDADFGSAPLFGSSPVKAPSLAAGRELKPERSEFDNMTAADVMFSAKRRGDMDSASEFSDGSNDLGWATDLLDESDAEGTVVTTATSRSVVQPKISRVSADDLDWFSEVESEREGPKAKKVPVDKKKVKERRKSRLDKEKSKEPRTKDEKKEKREKKKEKKDKDKREKKKDKATDGDADAARRKKKTTKRSSDSDSEGGEGQDEEARHGSRRRSSTVLDNILHGGKLIGSNGELNTKLALKPHPRSREDNHNAPRRSSALESKKNHGAESSAKEGSAGFDESHKAKLEDLEERSRRTNRSIDAVDAAQKHSAAQSEGQSVSTDRSNRTRRSVLPSPSYPAGDFGVNKEMAKGGASAIPRGNLLGEMDTDVETSPKSAAADNSELFGSDKRQITKGINKNGRMIWNSEHLGPTTVGTRTDHDAKGGFTVRSNTPGRFMNRISEHNTAGTVSRGSNTLATDGAIDAMWTSELASKRSSVKSNKDLFGSNDGEIDHLFKKGAVDLKAIMLDRSTKGPIRVSIRRKDGDKAVSAGSPGNRERRSILQKIIQEEPKDSAKRSLVATSPEKKRVQKTSSSKEKEKDKDKSSRRASTSEIDQKSGDGLAKHFAKAPPAPKDGRPKSVCANFRPRSKSLSRRATDGKEPNADKPSATLAGSSLKAADRKSRARDRDDDDAEKRDHSLDEHFAKSPASGTKGSTRSVGPSVKLGTNSNSSSKSGKTGSTESLSNASDEKEAKRGGSEKEERRSASGREEKRSASEKEEKRSASEIEDKRSPLRRAKSLSSAALANGLNSPQPKWPRTGLRSKGNDTASSCPTIDETLKQRKIARSLAEKGNQASTLTLSPLKKTASTDDSNQSSKPKSYIKKRSMD